MPRREKRSEKSTDEHTHLSLRIEDHRVRAKAGISLYAHNPQYAWRDTQDEPLYQFETHLKLSTICTDPGNRAGDRYLVSIYSDVSPDFYRKLKDVQAVNADNVRQYRTYRGRRIPIYKPPLGIGSLEKTRGEASWQGTVWATPSYVSDLMTLLGHHHQLYLKIHEKRIERQRWIQSIGIQTTDPAEE